jgi:dihydrofolate reductase
MAINVTINVTLVVAIGRNRVIGGGNRLLWHLKSDLRHFRAITIGKPLVMGRKTFESIGRPLPGRATFVVSRRQNQSVVGVTLVADLGTALERAAALAQQLAVTELIIAGGGEIYAQTIGLADRLCVTEVDLAPEGETLFPAIDRERWREVAREGHSKSIGDDADYSFVEYHRLKPKAH